MAGFFSKASSFLSSQADQEATSHGAKGDHNTEETRKPAGFGGYGDLLSSAQSFMNSSKPSDEGESVDNEGKSHKAPSSGGYGDLLANAQSLMGSTKLSGAGEGTPVDGKEEALKTTSSGKSDYGDMYASAQVLMGAAKASREGTGADMGEVAGASANLIGAASRYGNLEKSAYGEYAQKAETYLHDYQSSHGKASPKDLQKTEEEESNPPMKNPIRSSEEE